MLASASVTTVDRFGTVRIFTETPEDSTPLAIKCAISLVEPYLL